MATFKDNLSQAHRKFRHPSDRLELGDLARQFNDLVLEQELSEHPVIQKLLREVRELVNTTNYRLLNDAQASREVLIAQKNCYLWFLQVFAKNFEAEKAALNKQVETAL